MPRLCRLQFSFRNVESQLHDENGNLTAITSAKMLNLIHIPEGFEQRYRYIPRSILIREYYEELYEVVNAGNQ